MDEYMESSLLVNRVRTPTLEREPKPGRALADPGGFSRTPPPDPQDLGRILAGPGTGPSGPAVRWGGPSRSGSNWLKPGPQSAEKLLLPQCAFAKD